MWGIAVEELASRLSRADYTVLTEVDFSTADLSEALSLGPGAPYYLSFILDSLKKPETAELLLELAWHRSPSPWREEAGQALAERYLAEKDYERASDTARAIVTRAGAAPAAEKARRVLVAALYWSKSDERALAEAAKLSAPDAEVALIRAVSTYRLQQDSAHPLFVDLFLRQKLSAVHARAYLYLLGEPAALPSFSEAERDLLAGKFAFQQGDWARGVPLMEKVVSGLGVTLPQGSTIVSELGAAYLYGGMAARGAQYMENLARLLDGGLRLDALEAAGKCERRAAGYAGAISSFRALSAETPDPERADRARWFVLDALIKSGPADLMEQIGRESTAWNDPAFFSDLLEVEISTLAADRRWRDLYRLGVALEKTGPGPVRAQLSYILGRALQAKLVRRIPGGAGDRTPEDLLREAVQASPNRYYGVLAACLLGEVPQPVRAAAGASASGVAAGTGAGAAPAQPASPPEPTAAVRDPLTRGFITFGLTSQAYDRLWAEREGLPEPELLAAARGLAEAGDHRRALNLVGFLSRRRPLSAPELELFYPRAFRPLIERLAESSHFPDSLLYGLVREESYFDEGIVSSAGAVGLAQLMPETAADVARSLRMKDPDLRDPETNLTLGVEHLRAVYARVGSIPMALLAYNAGLTRSKRWDRVNGWLATDLFVEAVPFGESREYVRKILVSAVMYAYLYGGRDPRETVRLFFPDAFTPGKEQAGPLKGY